MSALLTFGPTVKRVVGILSKRVAAPPLLLGGLVARKHQLSKLKGAIPESGDEDDCF
jgi:hypothetical protein